MGLAAKDLKQETTETLLDDIIPTFSQEKIKRNGEVEKRKVHHYTALLRLTSTTIQRFSVSPVPLYSASPIYEVRFLLFRYKKLKHNLSGDT